MPNLIYYSLKFGECCSFAILPQVAFPIKWVFFKKMVVNSLKNCPISKIFFWFSSIFRGEYAGIIYFVPNIFLFKLFTVKYTNYIKIIIFSTYIYNLHKNGKF